MSPTTPFLVLALTTTMATATITTTTTTTTLSPLLAAQRVAQHLTNLCKDIDTDLCTDMRRRAWAPGGQGIIPAPPPSPTLTHDPTNQLTWGQFRNKIFSPFDDRMQKFHLYKPLDSETDWEKDSALGQHGAKLQRNSYNLPSSGATFSLKSAVPIMLKFLTTLVSSNRASRFQIADAKKQLAYLAKLGLAPSMTASACSLTFLFVIIAKYIRGRWSKNKSKKGDIELQKEKTRDGRMAANLREDTSLAPLLSADSQQVRGISRQATAPNWREINPPFEYSIQMHNQ
jgi:hypothetical protein